jgi:hypothetical protein
MPSLLSFMVSVFILGIVSAWLWMYTVLRWAVNPKFESEKVNLLDVLWEQDVKDKDAQQFTAEKAGKKLGEGKRSGLPYSGLGLGFSFPHDKAAATFKVDDSPPAHDGLEQSKVEMIQFPIFLFAPVSVSQTRSRQLGGLKSSLVAAWWGKEAEVGIFEEAVGIG